ncbi:DUF5654 family protein [Candidatus Parcubacteria bacterium]|nr:DUF5654 family protein [Candidatus Parcubacteria bacterium]
MKPKEKEIQELRRRVLKQMVTLATSAFGMIAALAWNSAITTFVNDYIKKILPIGSGVISLFIYAILVTILAVSVTYNLSKMAERFEEQ